MALKGLNSQQEAILREIFHEYLASEGQRASRQTIVSRQPLDPIRLVRATADVTGGATGMFQFISGSKGSETDTDEEPVEMWSPPGVDWETDDKGYALFIDTGWEVGRRSCTE